MEFLHKLKEYERNRGKIQSHNLWLEKMKEIYMDFPDITEKDQLLLIKHNAHHKFYKQFKKHSKKFVWLTIRPKACTIKTFKKFVTDFLKAKCIDKYYCAYESKPNDEGVGLHAHIILKGEISRISSKIAYFSKATTLPKIGKCRFFKKIHPLDHIQDKIDYCNGLTFAASKSEKEKENVINIQFRIENDLPTVTNLNSERYDLYLL